MRRNYAMPGRLPYRAGRNSTRSFRSRSVSTSMPRLNWRATRQSVRKSIWRKRISRRGRRENMWRKTVLQAAPAYGLQLGFWSQTVRWRRLQKNSRAARIKSRQNKRRNRLGDTEDDAVETLLKESTSPDVSPLLGVMDWACKPQAALDRLGPLLQGVEQARGAQCGRRWAMPDRLHDSRSVAA